MFGFVYQFTCVKINSENYVKYIDYNMNLEALAKPNELF